MMIWLVSAVLGIIVTIIIGVTSHVKKPNKP